jgi:signal transduction histidine kinase
MTAEQLVERLAAHRTLSKVPREQLAWLAARGVLLRLPAGALVRKTGEPIHELWVVLSGHLDIHLHRAGGWRRVMEWHGGDVTGLLPFSRMRGGPGDTRAVEDSEVLGVSSDHFPEMIRDCQELTGVLVHVMLDRARHFRASDLHDEKLASLGRLAAGLAHELNNPASAAARGAGVLAARLAESEAAFRALGALRMTDAELEAFAGLRTQCLAHPQETGRSPFEQAEREEALGEWLERHGVERAAGEHLAETEVTLAALDAAAAALGGEKLAAALAALAAACETRRLTADVERAASRVHELVAAVKGFTYMDQSEAPQPVDLARGIADTLTVMRSKAKTKSVRLSSVVEPGLPAVVGFGGELNQIWANLVDNAIDAVAAGGSVEVCAGRRGDRVVVQVVDDGPGIPAELRSRLFEPFFTTKPVGEGTGLGLSIARSLVDRHEGEIEVESRPGRTEFRVSLPVPAGDPAR